MAFSSCGLLTAVVGGRETSGPIRGRKRGPKRPLERPIYRRAGIYYGERRTSILGAVLGRQRLYALDIQN